MILWFQNASTGCHKTPEIWIIQDNSSLLAYITSVCIMVCVEWSVKSDVAEVIMCVGSWLVMTTTSPIFVAQVDTSSVCPWCLSGWTNLGSSDAIALPVVILYMIQHHPCDQVFVQKLRVEVRLFFEHVLKIFCVIVKDFNACGITVFSVNQRVGFAPSVAIPPF